MLQLNLNAADIFMDNGFKQSFWPDWLIGSINPAQIRQRYLQDAMIQSERTINTLSVRNVAELLEVDQTLKNAFGIKDLSELYDSGGKIVRAVELRLRL